MNIVDDDEFTSCQHCKSDLKPYRNTSLSDTSSPSPPGDKVRQTLSRYGHLNCEKCGVYIEIHPDGPSEEDILFVCSAETPHRHCLCQSCGKLYGLKADEERTNEMVARWMATSTDADSAESSRIEPDAPSSSLLAANALAGAMNVANNGTLIADLMSGPISSEMEAADSLADHDSTDAVSSLFLLSSIVALMVWQGIYSKIPELFRVSGIAIWFAAWYFAVTFYFNDNEPVAHAVFSLLTLSPTASALFLFERARRMSPSEVDPDTKLSIQFLSAFGGVAYLYSFCSPLAVFLEMAGLSPLQRVIALFIAVSVVGFILLLLKNCGFMWGGLRRECAAAQITEGPPSALELEIKETPPEEVGPAETKKVRRRRRRRRKRN